MVLIFSSVCREQLSLPQLYAPLWCSWEGGLPRCLGTGGVYRYPVVFLIIVASVHASSLIQ